MTEGVTSHDSRGTTRRQLPELTGESLPRLLTVSETASLLRTSPKSVYSMIDRGQLPGITRIGRRVLVRSRELLDWLDYNCASWPKE
jgi:excisionase family DNA binding protein